MALTVQELKKALVQAGFDVYRTRGDDVHLAERPRENLIMEAGVVVNVGLSVRVVTRAQRNDFPHESDEHLLARARSLGSSAVARGFEESAHQTRSLHDPGDDSKVIDVWHEITFAKGSSTLEELLSDVQFAVKLEKCATGNELASPRGGGPRRPRSRGEGGASVRPTTDARPATRVAVDPAPGNCGRRRSLRWKRSAAPA